MGDSSDKSFNNNMNIFFEKLSKCKDFSFGKFTLILEDLLDNSFI